MATKHSAGLLIYRQRGSAIEFLLVHPGGPLWAKKDLGAWSIPKGEFSEDEEPLTAALREFHEETGFTATGPYRQLTPIKQRGGKIVHAWAAVGEFDATAARSATFTMEWPPRSGRRQDFPEVDRAGWFPFEEARVRILESQLPLLEQLSDLLEVRPDPSDAS